MARKHGAKTLVWVTPSPALSAVKYGFSTSADATDRGTLGHTEVVRGTLLAGLVIGANNIKPARANKTRAVNSVSSFVDAEARAAALAAGFKITPGKNRRRISTTKTKAVYATINGVKVGYQLPILTGGATFAELGLTEVTGAELDVFYGASIPHAPVAKITYADGSTQSSIYDPTATLPDGWAQVKASELLVN